MEGKEREAEKVKEATVQVEELEEEEMSDKVNWLALKLEANKEEKDKIRRRRGVVGIVANIKWYKWTVEKIEGMMRGEEGEDEHKV